MASIFHGTVQFVTPLILGRLKSVHAVQNWSFAPYFIKIIKMFVRYTLLIICSLSFWANTVPHVVMLAKQPNVVVAIFSNAEEVVKKCLDLIWWFSYCRIFNTTHFYEENGIEEWQSNYYLLLLSIKQLKLTSTEADISIRGCAEKSHIVLKFIEANIYLLKFNMHLFLPAMRNFLIHALV